MAVAENITIEKENILVVEGPEDEGIFLCLAKHLNILSKLQVIPIGGKIDYPGLKAVISVPNFRSKVKAFGIVRDADDDPSGAFQSIKDSLSRLNLPCPTTCGDFSNNGSLKTGILILPDKDKNGAIEDVLISISEKNDAKRKDCINGFADCLISKGINLPRINKTKMYAYLSAFDEPGKRIREAARASYWNWDDDGFSVMCNFLKKLTS